MPFSKSIHQTITQHANLDIWKKFINAEPLGEHSIPAYIINGWKLSKKNNIDPLKMKEPNILNKKELNTLKSEYRILFQAAKPMLKMLAATIGNTGYIATLAVASGYSIAIVGDDKFKLRTKAKYNTLGANRSIKAIGASALTLSIIEKKTIIIQGAEHYNLCWHDLRCIAAPIFGYDANPIAAIEIANNMSLQDTHTLALVQSCAEGISIRMHEIILLENEKRLNAILNSVHNALPEFVLTVDHEGSITYANNQAITYLGLNPDIMNKTLRDLFGAPDFVRVQRLLNKGELATLEVEVISAHGPKNLMCRFSPIASANSYLHGMVISISKRHELLDLTRHVSGNYAKYCFDDIKGESLVLKEQITLASKAAMSNHRILLSGESGTGKELFAQSIHNASPSHAGPFVAISCAAIPRDLIESELFGYVGGAFTGARKNGMIGKIELATGGTLFLDEINSLPLEMQAKLLRVLQQMEIIRIGDTKPTAINARIIAATNKDLQNEVNLGQFREDLYFRINVIELVIPPLRKRKDDISLLAHIFLRRQSLETNRPFHHITAEALKAFYMYHWPGNIRELDNICERALLVSEDGIITITTLPTQLVNITKAEAIQKTVTSQPVSIQESTQELIINVLKQHNGNITKAAKQLCVARSTLYRKMGQFKIERY